MEVILIVTLLSIPSTKTVYNIYVQCHAYVRETHDHLKDLHTYIIIMMHIITKIITCRVKICSYE